MAYSFVAQGNVTRYEHVPGSHTPEPRVAVEELIISSGMSLQDLPVTFKGNDFSSELTIPEQKVVTKIQGTVNSLGDTIISLRIKHTAESIEYITETQYIKADVDYEIEVRDIGKVPGTTPWSFAAHPVRHLPLAIPYTLKNQQYSDGEASMARSYSISNVKLTGGSMSLLFSKE